MTANLGACRRRIGSVLRTEASNVLGSGDSRWHRGVSHPGGPLPTWPVTKTIHLPFALRPEKDEISA
jgi:hypothetical protein